MAEQEPGPSDEQLAEQLQRELARVPVRELLLQTAVGLIAIASTRLGLTPDTREDRDLAEARHAIDAIDAVCGLLDDQLQEQLRATIAQLKLGFAQAAADEREPAPGAPAQGDDEAAAAPERPPIWTPRGDV